MSTFYTKPSYDVNWLPMPALMVASPDAHVRYDGTTRIRDFDAAPKSLRYANEPDPIHTHFRDSQGKLRPNNSWDFHYFKDRRPQGDSWTYYKYMELPDGYTPRSRADGAEYHRSVQNERYFRREDSYELANKIVHPTHFSEITPERIAADPNQVIDWYYKGSGDLGLRGMQRQFEHRRIKHNIKRNLRKNQKQKLIALDDGDANKFDDIMDPWVE